MQVGRQILMPRSRNQRRRVACMPLIMTGLKKRSAEIVHQVVGVVGRRVAALHRPLPKKISGRAFGGGGLARIGNAEHVSFGTRGKPSSSAIRHQVDLIDAIEWIHALRGGVAYFPSNIARPARTGEILDCLEGALRTERSLDLHAAQRGVTISGGIPEGVGRKVGCFVGMAV